MKKILKYVVVVAIVAVAGVTAYNTQMDELQMSFLAMENIEAIASGEGSGPCEGYGRVLCPYNNFWVEKVN